MNVFERLFQTKFCRRSESDFIIGTGCTHVGQFLGLSEVKHEITIPVIFPTNLTFVDFILRFNKIASAILQFAQRIGKSGTGFHGNQGTVHPCFDGSLEFIVMQKAMRHHGFALGRGEQIGTKPDDSPGWNVEFQMGSVAFVFHVYHFTLTTGDEINGCSCHFCGQVDIEQFDGLVAFPVDFLVQHLWLTYLKFITFAAHGFNQYGKVKYPTTVHVP